jgi:hypothetical protein
VGRPPRSAVPSGRVADMALDDAAVAGGEVPEVGRVGEIGGEYSVDHIVVSPIVGKVVGGPLYRDSIFPVPAAVVPIERVEGAVNDDPCVAVVVAQVVGQDVAITEDGEADAA